MKEGKADVNFASKETLKWKGKEALKIDLSGDTRYVSQGEAEPEFLPPVCLLPNLLQAAAHAIQVLIIIVIITNVWYWMLCSLCFSHVSFILGQPSEMGN